MPRKSRKNGAGFDVLSFESQEKNATNKLKRRAEEKEIAGEIPDIANVRRRRSAEKSLKTFLTTYFPDIFYLDFSPIHLDVINKIEQTIEKGELYALAMPRGSGKTSICQCALVWAIVTGRAKCAVLCCANQSRATQLITDVYNLVSSNDRLAQDFPKEVYPFYMTSTTPRRLHSLTYNGVLTNAIVKSGQIVFPRIEGSLAPESVLFGVGLTGANLRGLSYTTSDGRKLRPDLVLCDDPQDRESANSPEQTKTRERLIKADLLGMAGAGRPLACLITCTVIENGDLADRLLDRAENPEFHGHRFSLISNLPKNLQYWETWNTIRQDELRNEEDFTRSLSYYNENRDAMQEGVVCNWEERKDRDDVDALVYAMRLYFRDKEAFWSEYMNKPRSSRDDEQVSRLTLEKCAQKLNHLKRGEVEDDDLTITGFIDVHQNLLYYALIAWKSDFSGHIIDYGVAPQQPRDDFKHDNPPNPIVSIYPGQSFESALSLCLQDLAGRLIKQEFLTPSGVALQVSRLLIDANWGQQTNTVYKAIRALRNPNILPYHGQFLGAKNKAFFNGDRTKGDQLGDGWRIPGDRQRNGLRYVVSDSNYWKSFFMRRVLAQQGTASNVSLFGSNKEEHEKFLQHLSAEYFKVVESGGRRVEEWLQRPGCYDNHWFDCCVGCCVGASIYGINLDANANPVKRTSKTSRFRAFVRQQQQR